MSVVASVNRPTLRTAVTDWLRDELPKWQYVLRTIAAAFTALFIAYRLEFSSPATAMITVFIVSVPQSGQVLAKSFYRVIGTLVGAVVGITLIGTIVQQRDLFLLLLAAWLGICTFGAAYFRGFQAYAFVLSGYTAGIIALPTVTMPEQVFDVALFRVSEVILGILCAGIFAELIFSRHSTDLLVRAVRGGFSGFVDYLQQAQDGRLDRPTLEETHLGFIDEAIQFEALRESSYFENPEARVRSERLRLFNAEFMSAGTAFYAYQEMLGRLRRRGDIAMADEYRAIGERLLLILHVEGRPPATAAEGRLALRRLTEFRRQLEPQLTAAHARLSAMEVAEKQADLTIVFDTVARQLGRFLEELTRYTLAYASLETIRGEVPHRAPPFSPHTDTVGAVRMGVRAFLTVLIVSIYWVSTGWAAGAGAVLIAGVVCALFAAAPLPEVAARKLLIGFVLGVPIAMIVQFGVLPRLDGFPLLIAGIAPFLMVTTYVIATPSTSAIGLGMNLQLLTTLNLNNVTLFDPVTAMNGALGQLLGTSIGLLMLTVIMPTHPRWFAERLRNSLRRQAIRACRAPLQGLRARFESRTRDLLVQLVTRADRSRGEHRAQLGQTLSVLDLGDAVIHLRRAARDCGATYPSTSLDQVLASLEQLLRQPVRARREQARADVLLALEDLRQLGAVRESPEFPSSGETRPLWRLHTDLVRIRGILRDDIWFADLARHLGDSDAIVSEPAEPRARRNDGAPTDAA